MQRAMAYVPIDRRDAWAHNTALQEQSEGVALFADISGFTTATEQLVAQFGPGRGAEELTHCLNVIYSGLISVIHQRGGSVVGFSGDALTCWFDGSRHNDGALADTCMQAVGCALDMQARMCEWQNKLTKLALTFQIKIALTQGKSQRYVVGHPDVQLIDIILGDAIERLMPIAHMLLAGEIATDKVTAALCPTLLHKSKQADESVVCIDTNQPAPPIPATLAWHPNTDNLGPAFEKQASKWLLQTSHTLSTPELRPAAALFLKFTRQNHADWSKAELNGYLCWVQMTLQNFGGELLQVTFGDKGSYLYAIFGAPVAHENDAPRAIWAAHALLASPPELAVDASRTQIGLAWGQMRVGEYGSADRCTFGVIGDATNIAARLMAAAQPSQVLCDEALRLTAQRAWTFEALPALHARGKVAPLCIYRPIQPMTRTAPTRFVGRQTELACGDQLIDALITQRHGHTLLIEGEAGIGKSQLAKEIAERARQHGAQVLYGAAGDVYGGSTSRVIYAPWRDVLWTYFELTNYHTVQDQQRMVSQHPAVAMLALQEQLPLLNEILGFDLPQTDVTQHLQSEQRSHARERLLINLLQPNTTQKPLVIILEDLHRFDSLSLRLTERLARKIQLPEPTSPIDHSIPILLILTTRPIELHPEVTAPSQLHQLAETAIGTKLQLEPLSCDDTQVLITERLGEQVAGVGEGLGHLVHIRCGGNPLYIEELVTSLQEQGAFAAPTDQSTQHTISTLMQEAVNNIPTVLQNILLTRLDQLQPEMQQVLKLASVVAALGEHFDTLGLGYLLKQRQPRAVSESSIATILQALVARDFIQPTDDRGQRYRFKHALLREAAYQTLLFAQRRELHGHIADWHEQIAATNETATAPAGQFRQIGAAQVALLAYHSRQAEDIQRERRYAWQAGKYTASQYANAEAIDYFNRVLDIAPDSEVHERYSALIELCTIYHRQSNLPKWRTILQQLDTLADSGNTTLLQRAEITRQHARLAQANGDYAAAASAAEAACQIAQMAGDVACETAARIDWSLAERGRSCYGPAQHQLDLAIDLAQAHGLPSLRARALDHLGTLACIQADYATARKSHEQVLALRQTEGNLYEESGTANNLGIVEYRMGDYTKASSLFEHALQLTRRIGDRSGEIMALGNRAIVANATGQLTDALAAEELALAAAIDISDRYCECHLRNNIGNELIQLGRYQRAKQMLEMAQQVSRDTQDDQNLAYVLNNLGHLAFLQDQTTAAENYLHHAITLAERLHNIAALTEGLIHLSYIQSELGNGADASKLARRGITYAQDNGDKGQELDAWRALGTAALRTNDWIQAQTAFEQSAQYHRHIHAQTGFADTCGLAAVTLALGDATSALTLLEPALLKIERVSIRFSDDTLAAYQHGLLVLHANGDSRIEWLRDKLIHAHAGTG